VSYFHCGNAEGICTFSPYNKSINTFAHNYSGNQGSWDTSSRQAKSSIAEPRKGWTDESQSFDNYSQRQAIIEGSEIGPHRPGEKRKKTSWWRLWGRQERPKAVLNNVGNGNNNFNRIGQGHGKKIIFENVGNGNNRINDFGNV
jgi:hypothetical protein